MEVAAASIAVVQIADRVLTLCKAYVDGVREAPDDFRLILIEVSSLKPILEAVEYLATTTRSLTPRKNANPSLHAVLRSMSGTTSPLEGCRDALIKLEALLPKETDQRISPNVRDKTSNSKRKSGWPFKRKAAITDTALALRPKQEICYDNLKWPFKKTAAERLLNELGRHKATLSLGLAIYTLEDSRNFHDKLEYLVAMPGQVKINQILDWLVTVDISSIHDKILALCYRGTGQWILQHPAYVDWKEQNRRMLWLHGGPGSGKTVLVSNVVEDLKACCQRRQFVVCGWAYYYCDFDRGYDEMPHFFRWVISQLCRQLNHVPQEVQDLSQVGPDLTLKQLAIAFTAVVRRFDHVYLILDGLNEMQDRKTMMDFIIHVRYHKDLEKVQILVVSRKYDDIHQALDTISTEIVLADSEVNKDILAYAEHKLSSICKHQSIRDEIKTQIVARAAGYFSLADCALSALDIVDIDIDTVDNPMTEDDFRQLVMRGIEIGSAYE